MRRKARTSLTVMGMALIVAAVVFMMAFSRSMTNTFRKTGDHDNLIVISKKAETFVLSSISAVDSEQVLLDLYDDAVMFEREDDLGEGEEPLISQEVYIGLNVEALGAATFREGEQRALVHGVDPEIARRVNSSVKILEGRWPERGNLDADADTPEGGHGPELMVGSMAATRLGVEDEALAVGKKLRLLDREWTIVGLFEAPGTIMDCEIWAHAEDLKVCLRRRDYSFIRAKIEDPTKITEICERLSTDEQFEVKAFPEQTYFANYARGFDYFKQFAHVMALVIIAGGVIAGLNTMYTSVMGRVREIGTLQVIGFSKKSVLVSILVESILISLVAGVIGCALGYLANGLPMKIPMAAFRVQVDLIVFGWAMAASLFIGLCGAFVPAYRSLRLRMVDAVRRQ